MSESEIAVLDIQKDLVRILLRNTIETYPPEWRLIQEPLQNAIDSFINIDGTTIDMKGEEPTVVIELDIGDNRVNVIDNGKGVPLSQCCDFIHLGSGSKGAINEDEIKKLLKGSQGVGIKASVFTSEFFNIETICDGERWSMTLNDFYNYSDPTFKEKMSLPKSEKVGQNSGTKISLRLHDYSVWDFIYDRIMDFFKTVEIDNEKIDVNGKIDIGDGRPIDSIDPMKILMRYFKKDSYAGCVTRSIDSDTLPKVKFILKVIPDPSEQKGNDYHISGIKPFQSNKLYVQENKVGYLDYREIIEQLPSRQRPKIVTDYKAIMESGNKFNEPAVFYQILTKSDVKSMVGQLRKRRKGDPQDVTKPLILVPDTVKEQKYKTVLGKINGGILFIASRPFLKNPLAHKSSICLSVNGLPTDIILDVSGAELGYLPSTHLVLDVSETLGYGKRNLHPKSKGSYNNLGKDLWRNLHKLAKLIVTEEESFDPTIDGFMFDKTAEFIKIEKKNSAQLKKFHMITGRSTQPETEEDVIATYFHMVGRGYLTSHNWIRLNDRTVYDGILIPGQIKTEEMNETKIFTVEFKYKLQDLCESDEERRQRFEDIQLAIVWRMGSNEDLPADYNYVTMEQDIGYSHYLPDVNYRVKHARHSIQVICLEDIVTQLMSENIEIGGN